jgi:NAD(P)-dependent dehydrogenase (short-subunit alcohol dehydrogenase family)
MKVLEGKVILVTGSGNGVGKAHAIYFASQGAKVVVNDIGADVLGGGRSSQPAEDTVAAITAAGGNAVVSTHDISNWDGARQAVHAGIEAFGRFDGVVNNAGNLRLAKLTDLTEADIDASFAVHLKGSFATTIHACRYWRERYEADPTSRGAIVNTISDAMIVALDRTSAYAAAKAGVGQLTINGSREAAEYGVRLNAYGPRAFTRMSTASYKNAGAPPTDGSNPKDPGNVSPFIAWLLSDRAQHVTGQIFATVGGGISLCTRLTAGEMHWPPEGQVLFKQEQIELLVNSKIFNSRVPDMPLQEPPGWVAGSF